MLKMQSGPRSLRSLSRSIGYSNLPKLQLSDDETYDDNHEKKRPPNPLTTTNPSWQIEGSKLLDITLKRVDNSLDSLPGELSEEDKQSVCIPKNQVLLIPLSLLQSQARNNRSANISSASLDSGVCSAGASKRASLEISTPDCNTPLGAVQKCPSILNPNESSKKVSSSSVSSFSCFSYSEESEEVRNGALLDSTTCKRPERLSINVDKFAELLQAAMKLVDDAQPVVDSTEEKSALGPNGKDGRDEVNSKSSLKERKMQRTRSELIRPISFQQTGTVQKKRSVGQAIPGSRAMGEFSKSLTAVKTQSRTSAACIICERNKRTTGGQVTSRVLVKTTMARAIQEKKRYSEVLKIYKPGDIPYTDMVISRISDLKTPTGVIRESLVAEKIHSIVDENMPKFLQLTSWGGLYAYLISKRLLDAHMREFINSSATQQQKGNAFYGEYMPSLGHQGYLKLMECFQEEQEHLGHVTLAKILENGIKKKL